MDNYENEQKENLIYNTIIGKKKQREKDNFKDKSPNSSN